MKSQKTIIAKNHDCSSSECINNYLERGSEGVLCANCVEELKRFVGKLGTPKKKQRERERENKNK